MVVSPILPLPGLIHSIEASTRNVTLLADIDWESLIDNKQSNRRDRRKVLELVNDRNVIKTAEAIIQNNY